MIKYNLIKESVNKTEEKRIFNITPITFISKEEEDRYIKTIVEKIKNISELPSDFKLPNVLNVNYDITYR